ncbi:MAG: amidohydrolase [Burkholderiaceae bacterium]|nr:MAG: amidohydrolase [Burkholderiaceae bacterium]
MPIDSAVTPHLPELVRFRHEMHQHPELMYDLPETSKRVAAALRAAGADEVHEGLGKTGVVAVIRGKKNGAGRSIGLRADMDALPVREITGKPYASKNEGRMHACGHDGHTTMLLGAAMGLADTRDFDGTVNLIFQPAEEGGAGADAMIQDGLFKRFPVNEVYGMHNRPGLPLGQFALRPGSMMASADTFTIELDGVGGHAAQPHTTTDTMPVMAALIQALQTIVARNVDPIQSAVVSVTMVHGGDAFNVIPPVVKLCGTVRTLDESVRDLVEARLHTLAGGIASAFGAKARVAYHRSYPVLVNHAENTEFAARAAEAVVGAGQVDRNLPPTMGSEDFAFMLKAVPGAYINIGNGDSAGIHHPDYDFNDEAIAWGASYWMSLARGRLPLKA